MGKPHPKVLLRRALSEAQNHRCCYCGIRMEGERGKPDSPTLEHLTPRSHGGAAIKDNLAVACRKCNQGHGNTSLPRKMRAAVVHTLGNSIARIQKEVT